MLLLIAWFAITGGFDQTSRSDTIGQKVQTTIQLICGVFSLVLVITYFIRRQWVRFVSFSWAASLVLASGLSALVWGPPMWHIALVFAIAAFLFSLGILWMLQSGFGWARDEENSIETKRFEN